MFEITTDHIAALDDTDARLLIGKLCELEAKTRGLDTSGITYGGDQRAADGGVDVSVVLPDDESSGGHFPRRVVGYQVKAEKFSAAKVKTEMRPSGILRSSILEINKDGGAYIIVSTQESTTRTMLSKRRNAMAKAVSETVDEPEIHLDFYDRQRVASWVNEHQSLVPWVLERIGKPQRGWQPFKDWSSSPDAVSADYILDDVIRIVGVRLKDTNGLPAEHGINEIRSVLARPRGLVRLVGLSGVGKTRLVQALFDNRVGVNPLDPSKAIYTDLSDKPDPVPLELLSQFVARQQSGILIIDNCGVELHRKMGARLREGEHDISVITIEYDISDDEPENTDVFKLEPASGEQIEKILERKFTNLSQPEIRTIANFSEGNSRVAIALANTSSLGGSLANLTDTELFKRLFIQNKDTDADLLKIAKAISLVYSFDGESTDESESELSVLSKFADLSVSNGYRQIAELERRKLLQRRGKWRALLPHALAHRLAKEQLQEAPPKQISDAFVHSGNERLLKSFSRRLGFLHDSEIAQQIVSAWLEPGGWLDIVEKFNEVGRVVFDNVAPVSPQLTLESIERAFRRSHGFSGADSSITHFVVKVLRSLAYEDQFFDRALMIIAQLAAEKGKTNVVSDSYNVFGSLFVSYLSGSHASPKTRQEFLSRLIRSDEEKFAELALSGLTAMLKTHHFSSFYGFEFGTRKRDYGYYPQTAEDIVEWYGGALDLLKALFDQFPDQRQALKQILASQFKWIGQSTGLVSELCSLARYIHDADGWAEGWASVKSAVRDSAKKDTNEIADQLQELADYLEPKETADLITTYALPETWSILDLAEVEFDEPGRYEKAQRNVREACNLIGQKLARDRAVLDDQLPRLVLVQSQGVGTIGVSLGRSASDLRSTWKALGEAFKTAAPNDRKGTLLSGFLAGAAEQDAALVEEFLDSAMNDSEFADVFLQLQTSISTSDRGFERVLASLKRVEIPSWSFRNLAYQPASNGISDERLLEIIESLQVREDGYQHAVFLLQMRREFKERKQGPTDIERRAGLLLLENIRFSLRGQQDDYEIAGIAEWCMRPGIDEKVAIEVCRRLLAAVRDPGIGVWDYGRLVKFLSGTFPRPVLDTFVAADGEDFTGYRIRGLFAEFRERSECPIQRMDVDLLVDWANEDPEVRYGRLANATRPWRIGAESEDLVLSEHYSRLVEATPDPVSVLEVMLDRLPPRSWSGSRADIMQKRMVLLTALLSSESEMVRNWAKEANKRFQASIDSEREREAAEDRRRDERFEW